MTAEDVDLSLGIGWAAFEGHVRALAEGELSRDLIYGPMRIEVSALIRLLEVAPESEHGKIRELLGRYNALMATLVN